MRRPLAAGACAAIVALLLAAGPAPAAMYKWTDANGRVIYSDQPPPGDVKVESISAPPPPANPNAVRDLANKAAELAQRRTQRADEENNAAKARAEAAKKREQCGKVRGQIALMQSDQLIVRSNEKGEQVVMDDAARRKERQDLEAWVKQNCAG
jgi:hypothetical protein